MKYQDLLPKNKRPIVIIGAGSIVNDAHLPAYKIASFHVAGIFDINKERAKTIAQKFDIPVIYESLEQLVEQAPKDAVFDMALPASEIISSLLKLPEFSSVLIQKPMGNNFMEAKKILQIVRSKKLIAGINFQLRYAPYILAAKNIINKGLIGELCDIEINVNIYHPFHLWDFLFKSERVEILYHSIHYIDLVRSFFGNPEGIYAKTVKHPKMPALASVRSSIIMNYGDWIRAIILTNHCHDFNQKYQHAYIKFEGTKGAVRINMGLLMDYPKGTGDIVEFISNEGNPKPEWQNLEVEGTWFPEAFIGSMSQVMKAASGEIELPDNSVEDCIYTMACVEAAYESSAAGGTKLPG
ncbi:MAG: Gfo/Idh/MocA family oxidoreductase [Ferruginibacter sp.]